MALDELRLKNSLKQMYQDAEANGGDNRIDQLDYFCGRLAHVLIEEIKNLNVNYIGGLTAGSAAVTGVINHTVT